jgi:predicted ArsR family transcriptional regulator
MKTTRKLIIDYLKEKRAASTIEIGHALRVTPANIRHHLAVLADEGVVQIAGERPANGRGRPTHLYGLTEEVQEHSLDRLADALLREFIEVLPDSERASALERIANRLIEPKSTAAGNLTQRLYAAVSQLNELNYQARWEAHSKGPRLRLGHCPYAAILPEHPELCQLDKKLLEEFLATPVFQTAKLVKDRRGEKYCAFTLLISSTGKTPTK